jgi:hypothetical protein
MSQRNASNSSPQQSPAPSQPTPQPQSAQESPIQFGQPEPAQPTERERELEQQLAKAQEAARIQQQDAAEKLKEAKAQVDAALFARDQTERQLVEATTAPATDVEKAKAAFEVPEGEEGYTHVYVTHKNGVPVERPQVEPYHPNVWKQLAKSPNIVQGEVFHKGK